MPSGTMSTITMAPPGVFATSMPPELSNSASPVLSSEDRESVSSTESRRRRLGVGVANCTAPVTGPNSQALSSSFCTSPTFVIESPKPDHSNEPFAKVRKKTRGHRNRGGGGSHNGSSPYSVNKPLKVTIRRTNAHSHTLNSSMQDGVANRLSPSSVYSSVPGDDETSPIRVLSPHHHHNIPNSCSSSSKAVDYTVQGSAQRDVAISTMDKATSTEPDRLGPCEPGTKVSLTGSVWMETPGMLCVNVNWRGRSYVGTLMDFTKNGLNLACPSKMITSLSCLKNKITWNPAAAGIGGNLGSSGTSGSVKTRSSNPGGTEGRGRPLTSARGRRKRRGYGQLTTSSSTNTLVSDGMESNQEDEAPSSNNPQPDADSPIECPVEECGKRFPDFRCLQCHLQQSHRTQKKSKMEYMIEETGLPRTASSPSAPELAKAISSSTDCVQLAENNSNDEDIPPPTLDRGPSVSEEQVPLSSDHPPTASPAYSDISDDAPASPKITAPKPAIDSNPPPSWQPHPTVVPQKPPQQPPSQPVQNPPQSQPVDWSINPRMPPAPANPINTTVPHSHPPAVPPVRSSPYDFDPTTAAVIMARLQGQFTYPPSMHSSPYQTNHPSRPHKTATPNVSFNVPRNPQGLADFSPAQLATLMAYQQELARRHQSELQRPGRSPQQQQQQRHSPHLPPGMGAQQQFRPPPQ